MKAARRIGSTLILRLFWQKDFSNMPETPILTAEFDPLRDEGEDYGKKTGRGWQLCGSTPDQRCTSRLFCSLESAFSMCRKVSYMNEFLKREGEKLKEGYSNWRKLDNAALAFPLVTGKNDTRVFRFYCELKENVKPELLRPLLKKPWKNILCFRWFSEKDYSGSTWNTGIFVQL